MANSDDVLTRAERWLALDPLNGDGSDGYHTTPLIRALAAEVRELRRDRARLDWMLFHGVMVMTSPEIWCDRAEIDAAMGGGEGEG